jgi:membrane protein DedA with SNARE-associated domain
VLWAIAYAALGVLSGGIFDSPLLATLLATLLILVLGGVLNLVSSRRRRRRKAAEPTPEHSEPS